jgi:hypothetical protein
LHEFHGLSFVFHLRVFDELPEVVIVHILLARKIGLESITGEEAVEALAVVDVGTTVEEDPILRTEELVRGIYDTGLDEGGRVEDFARYITGRGNHNESGSGMRLDRACDQMHTSFENVLVEDGDTAQVPRHPFLVVFGELGVHRL